MALVTHRRTAWHHLSASRGMLGLAACLTIGGCAQMPIPGGPDPLTLNDGKTDPKPGEPTGTPQTAGELAKATEYWGKQYAANSRDLKVALNYARNLRAMGEKQRALEVVQQASIFHGDSRELAGDYGRLALDLDQAELAGRLLAIADDPVHPDWRIVSARGTVLAKLGKYTEAIPFYDRALTLAPGQPSVLSNLALATAMSGNAARAEQLLRQAEAADSNSPKIRQNLALVLGLQGKYDEAKLIAARDLPMETAAENNSFLRQVVKLEPKTVPSTVDASVDVAEAPASQAKWSALAHAAKAPEAKPSAKGTKAEVVPVAEAAHIAPPWATDMKQAAAAPASGSADEATIGAANVADPAKTAKPDAKTAAVEVTHRDIDLSLRAPTPAKTADAATATPPANGATTTPAPTPVSVSATEADIWTASIGASAKKTNADAKTAAAEVTHRDIDLSPQAPAASHSAPAKMADAAAVPPLASVGAPAKKATTDAKTAAAEVTHRDIDLSLRAPAASHSAPAKKADSAAVPPPGKGATTSWTPVAVSGAN